MGFGGADVKELSKAVLDDTPTDEMARVLPPITDSVTELAVGAGFLTVAVSTLKLGHRMDMPLPNMNKPINDVSSTLSSVH